MLAGQTACYLELQLRDFQDGRRQRPTQAAQTATLQAMTRTDLRRPAAWYAGQAALPPRAGVAPDAASAKLGKADEALCTTCHLGGFAGQHEIPRVAGQGFDAVLQQLRAFKSGERSNDGGNMSAVTRLLTDAELQHVAHDITGL